MFVAHLLYPRLRDFPDFAMDCFLGKLPNIDDIRYKYSNVDVYISGATTQEECLSEITKVYTRNNPNCPLFSEARQKLLKREGAAISISPGCIAILMSKGMRHSFIFSVTGEWTSISIDLLEL